MIELIGFEKEYNDLLKRYKSNNLPNSILIHGLSGIGKRTFLNKLVKNILNIVPKSEDSSDALAVAMSIQSKSIGKLANGEYSSKLDQAIANALEKEKTNMRK